MRRRVRYRGSSLRGPVSHRERLAGQRGERGGRRRGSTCTRLQIKISDVHAARLIAERKDQTPLAALRIIDRENQRVLAPYSS